MPDIKLPDGSSREYNAAVTVAALALDIGEGLSRAALAGLVDGRLVDLSFEISVIAGCNYQSKINLKPLIVSHLLPIL